MRVFWDSERFLKHMSVSIFICYFTNVENYALVMKYKDLQMDTWECTFMRKTALHKSAWGLDKATIPFLSKWKDFPKSLHFANS